MREILALVVLVVGAGALAAWVLRYRVEPPDTVSDETRAHLYEDDEKHTDL